MIINAKIITRNLPLLGIMSLDKRLRITDKIADACFLQSEKSLADMGNSFSFTDLNLRSICLDILYRIEYEFKTLLFYC